MNQQFTTRPFPPADWPRRWGTRPEATDGARALAAKHSLDLRTIAGTGKDGRITARDVRQALRARRGQEEPT